MLIHHRNLGLLLTDSSICGTPVLSKIIDKFNENTDLEIGIPLDENVKKATQINYMEDGYFIAEDSTLFTRILEFNPQV